MPDRNFDAAGFDPAALRAFLDDRFGTTDCLEIERISGGQSNPTCFVTHGDRHMVLRKKPAGPILPGAHAIEREYRVLTALHGSIVPVARPILLHEDPEPLGTPFYLMERVEGRVFTDCALPGLDPEERRDLWMGLADALAKVHSVEPDEIGLGDYGRPGNYFERQIGRWTRQWRQSSSDPIPAIDRLAEWLPENLPEDGGMVRLAHGDFRMGNMLFHPTEPRVVAILDWELSTLGDPLADLGFCVMPWHTSPEEYGGILGLDRTGLGIPEETEFVERYRQGAPGVAPLLPFHKAFALFRFAVIFVGIADRARTGSAAAENAVEVGPLAGRFAERALEIVEGREHMLWRQFESRSSHAPSPRAFQPLRNANPASDTAAETFDDVMSVELRRTGSCFPQQNTFRQERHPTNICICELPVLASRADQLSAQLPIFRGMSKNRRRKYAYCWNTGRHHSCRRNRHDDHCRPRAGKAHGRR